MNKVFAVLSLLFTTTLSAATIRGMVGNPAGFGVEGCRVSIGNLAAATTDAEGRFSFEVPEGTYELRVVCLGYTTATQQVKTGEDVSVGVAPLGLFEETMVVDAIRADDQTPVTKTDMEAGEIEQRYHGQDIPLLLRETPSITAYSESGVGGAGYSYISLRGISPTRINFTLDGVPLADSEDMATYFADFPDLARSLESIQIQRGVGTSTVGSASFGGSVNMESMNLTARDPFVEATLGLGSFGNRQVSAAVHDLAPWDDSIRFYTRLSFLENDGYRDNSGMRQRNVFFIGEKDLQGSSKLRLTGFSGRESQQLSFFATDAETLKVDPRNNPLRPEEKDSFGYDLAQLSFIHAFDWEAALTASAYYQRGYGWYRLFDFGTDVLAEYGLDGMLLGGMVTYTHDTRTLNVKTGVHVNRFKRDHTRDDLSAGRRDYANYGVKGEVNAFAKVEWNAAGKLRLYGDAQVRYAGFEYNGDVAIDSVSWTFFNPKVGARYRTSNASSVYASLGMTTREPARNDFFHGEDNPTVAYDPRAVRPERVYDFEAGWTYLTSSAELSANVYAMEFRNEIALTGELSDIGLPLRRNVDRSYRRGIELDLKWYAAPALRLITNANFSRNRIEQWGEFRNVEPLLTPKVIVTQAADYSPNSRFSIGGIGRWVRRSYLDNTNDETLVTPSYFLLDANVSYAVNARARVSVQINNALNNDRVYASGYSFDGVPYYYPQATRNAVVLLDLQWR